MLEFYGDLGLNIDGKYHNVALVHTMTLDQPMGGTWIPFYHDNGSRSVTMAYDLDIPTSVNHPIVGVTAKDGVGVAQIVYSRNGQRKVRVYIGFCQYMHNGQYVNQDNAEQVIRELNIKVYLYDINPQIARSNYGLQVFNERGELLFSSDFNPLKIGVKGDTNDGNHVIFTQTFCDYIWFERYSIRWEHTLSEHEIKTPVMLDTVYKGQAMKFENYMRDVLKIDLGFAGDMWIRSLQADKQKYHMPIIGHILC